MKAIITVGVSASGKSTWAKDYVRLSKTPVAIVERDEIRRELLTQRTDNLYSGELVWAKWNWKWEDEVTAIQKERITHYAQSETDVIISDTNLNEGRRNALIQFLTGLGYDVSVKMLICEFEQAAARDAARKNGVGVPILAWQFDQFHKEMTPQYLGTKGKPDAIIVDIDGTLAKMIGRSPYDWERVGEDEVHGYVREVVNALSSAGYVVIIVSGRDGSCEELTKSWLQDNMIAHDSFFMRQAGDIRSDVEIKSEIFWNEIAPNFNVKMVFDDRPKVCRMWRSIGMNVLQVGNPHIEF